MQGYTPTEIAGELLLRDMLVILMDKQVIGISIRAKSGREYSGDLTEVHSTFCIIANHLVMLDSIESVSAPPLPEKPEEVK